MRQRLLTILTCVIVVVIMTRERTGGINQASQKERMKSLLAFTNTDVNALTESAVYDWVRRLTRHIGGEGIRAARLIGADKRALEEAFGRRHTGTRPDGQPYSAPARALLSTLHARLAEGIALLATDHPWRIDGPRQWRLEPSPNRTLTVWYEDEWRTSLLAAAAQTLSVMWPALRRCRRHECGRVFLPEPPHQQYCCPRCSNLTRWARFAPTRERNYAAEYDARIARRVGRKLRTHRRPRRKAS